MRYETVDGCPVPQPLAAELRALKDATGATLNSCYRGHDARHLLARHGKLSQRQLWEGWKARRPGFNPANPPGRSTHELRSDGVAYPGPVGRRLRYWQVGMDWDPRHVEVLVQAARRRGWIVVRPYADGREMHHLNFRKEPKLKLKPLKLHSRGARVIKLTTRLHVIRDENGRRYMPRIRGYFGKDVRAAVKKFQADHGQKPDGIVGPHTNRALAASYRYHRKKGRK